MTSIFTERCQTITIRLIIPAQAVLLQAVASARRWLTAGTKLLQRYICTRVKWKSGFTYIFKVVSIIFVVGTKYHFFDDLYDFSANSPSRLLNEFAHANFFKRDFFQNESENILSWLQIRNQREIPLRMIYSEFAYISPNLVYLYAYANTTSWVKYSKIQNDSYKDVQHS